MTRPDPQLAWNVEEETRRRRRSAIPRNADEGVSELAMARAANLPAQHVRHQLHAVADAEDGRAEVEESGVALRCAGVGYAARSTRENQSDGIARAELVRRRVERHDLRVDVQLAKTTGDELRVL